MSERLTEDLASESSLEWPSCENEIWAALPRPGCVPRWVTSEFQPQARASPQDDDLDPVLGWPLGSLAGNRRLACHKFNLVLKLGLMLMILISDLVPTIYVTAIWSIQSQNHNPGAIDHLIVTDLPVVTS